MSPNKPPMTVWINTNVVENRAYSFSVLGITTIDGVQIRNPLLALSEEFMVSPEGWGFQKYGTGGGCMAYRLDLAGGDYLMLTDASGTDLPTPQDYETALLGRYTSNGDPVALIDVKDIPRREA